MGVYGTGACVVTRHRFASLFNTLSGSPTAHCSTLKVLLYITRKVQIRRWVGWTGGWMERLDGWDENQTFTEEAGVRFPCETKNQC